MVLARLPADEWSKYRSPDMKHGKSTHRKKARKTSHKAKSKSKRHKKR